MSSRAAGLLLHPTSLPGAYGIGDLGPAADVFCAWLAAGGQSVWQILPLGPTHENGSPYSALSAFAGNPYLISPERLRDEGLVPASLLAKTPSLPESRVDFALARRLKDDLLHAALEHIGREGPPELRQAFEAFRAEAVQQAWLPDYALHAALRRRFDGKPWQAWDRELRERDETALAAARRELRGAIELHELEQFLFYRQWDRLRSEASRNGIRILGDLPMYVAPDSADVWVHRELFALDPEGRPEKVAGVPPDYFSATGQLWGNPLYRWERMREDGFAWWIARLRANLRMADVVRLDHFRGLVAYWEVAATEKTAEKGRWVEGPGAGLLEAARRELGGLPLLAEDLGLITSEVGALRDAFGLPGMKVLQFAFGDDDSDHLPHHHVVKSAVYTGTHDNDTARGWFESVGPEERARVTDYLGSDGHEIGWDLLRAAHASVAETAIVPAQDVFGLGTEARMNVPGRAAGNWSFRAEAWRFSDEVAARLARQARLAGRFPKSPATKGEGS